jgi:hypothetical protein
LREQPIAVPVPEGVVDVLEPVEVYEQHSDHPLPADAPLCGVLQALHQKRAVWQVGERVVGCLVLELLL